MLMCILSNLSSITRISGNTDFVHTPCNDPLSLGAAALLGGTSLLGNMFGGIFGSSSQSKANKMNYKIWQEQKEFNREEAQKQRDWQEQMQQSYGTSIAKANDLRAAGLNAKLGDVSASQVGSGATAVSPQASTMQAVNPMSGFASGLSQGVSDFLSAYHESTERASQESQKEVNDTIKALNESVQALNYKKVDLTDESIKQLRLNNAYLHDTLSTRVRLAFLQESISTWMVSDTKYKALSEIYAFNNIAPATLRNIQAQTAFHEANAIKALAEGKLTLKEFQYYEKNYALRQVMANAMSRQANAAEINAKTFRDLYNEQRRGMSYDNDLKQYSTDYWLGNIPDDEAHKYILRTPPLLRQLKAQLGIQEQTFTNLTFQPDLLRSITHSNEAHATRDEWGKWSDAVNAGSNVIQSVGNVVTKGVSGAAKSKLDNQKFEYQRYKDSRTKYHQKTEHGYYEFSE